MKEDNIDNKNINKDKKWYMPAFYFYGKVTSWILVPLFVAFFGGKYVKNTTGSQILFFIFVFVAFCITCFGIYREIKIYKKNVE